MRPGTGATNGFTRFCQVMTKPKNALTKQYKFQFCLDDVDFHMTGGALRAVAQIAIKKNTGARGLRSIMDSLLLEVISTESLVAFWTALCRGHGYWAAKNVCHAPASAFKYVSVLLLARGRTPKLPPGSYMPVLRYYTKRSSPKALPAAHLSSCS